MWGQSGAQCSRETGGRSIHDRRFYLRWDPHAVRSPRRGTGGGAARRSAGGHPRHVDGAQPVSWRGRRGRHCRVHEPGGRRLPECGPPRRSAGRSAGGGRRYDPQPVVRQRSGRGGGCVPGGRVRTGGPVHRRGGGEHEPCTVPDGQVREGLRASSDRLRFHVGLAVLQSPGHRAVRRPRDAGDGGPHRGGSRHHARGERPVRECVTAAIRPGEEGLLLQGRAGPGDGAGTDTRRDDDRDR